MMNTAEGTHLHLELKVLVLPLPAENVTRNANFNGLLKAVRAPERTRDQVLQMTSPGERKKEKRRRKRRRVKG